MNEEIERVRTEIETKPIFQVLAPDGHRFAIYPDGKIEGFPDGSIVFNMVQLYKHGWIAITKAEMEGVT